MALTRQAARWGQARLARRLGRSLPLLGAAIALYALRNEIRRKGFLGGTANTALDAIPFFGAAKNAVEMYRGDFIPDRPVGIRRA